MKLVETLHACIDIHAHMHMQAKLAQTWSPTHTHMHAHTLRTCTHALIIDKVYYTWSQQVILTTFHHAVGSQVSPEHVHAVSWDVQINK